MEDDGNGKAVKFILTDIHPHIPEWTRAAKKSEHLSFVGESVDATNAPASLYGKDGKKIFRLYNLAFHHFDHKLGLAILKNTIETADGFGYIQLSSFFSVQANMIQRVRATRTHHLVSFHCMSDMATPACNHALLFLALARSSVLHIPRAHHTFRSGV